jgi:hypothetical protein
VDNTNADATGGDIQAGIFARTRGDGNTSTQTKYAAWFVIDGTASANYGIFIDVTTAATNNYSIWANSGMAVFNSNQDSNSHFWVLGSGTDGIYFDANNDWLGIRTLSPERVLHVEGDYIFRHDPVGTTGTNRGYGEVVTFGSGSLTQGNLYYLASSGTWTPANASAASTSTGMLGIALGSAPSDGILVRGYYSNSTWSFTTGDILYVSQVLAGVITNTAPSASGTVIRIVGYSINTASDVIYFNPSNDWTEN